MIEPIKRYDSNIWHYIHIDHKYSLCSKYMREWHSFYAYFKEVNCKDCMNLLQVMLDEEVNKFLQV